MNSLLHNSRKHDIAFYANGRIDISANVAKTLSLSPGDVIDILEHDKEWYIGVKLRAGEYTGRHQGKVYATHRSTRGSYRTWSRTITRLVLAATGQHLRLRCPCGEVIERNNQKYVTIIYHCSL